jgi:hypothetical protein
MTITETSNKAWTAFKRYLESGDKSLTESFSRKDLVSTLGAFHLDQGRQEYKAIEARIVEIDYQTRRQNELKDIKREKWKDRGIGFLAGIVLAIISFLLSKL